jgi:hypothetical protein
MSNQQKRQQSVRAVTGTAYTYADDWHALFDADLIAEGHYNDRLRAWINVKLSSNYSNVNDAMRAYAVSKSVTRWGELGTFTP